MFHWFWIFPLWFLFAPFHGFLTLVLVILIVSLIFRRHYYYYGYPYRYHPWHWGWGQPPANARSEALAVLEGRYARGEIQRDEYLQKKADLGG